MNNLSADVNHVQSFIISSFFSFLNNAANYFYLFLFLLYANIVLIVMTTVNYHNIFGVE